MQKADGHSVKELFHFAGCGECGLGFCFWQRPCGRRKLLPHTKRCVLSAANWVAMLYIKSCRFVAVRAIRSPRGGKLLWKIHRADCANWKLLTERLILTTPQVVTSQVRLKERRSMSRD